jgi:CubicO group peptidase (beta-lactamase class C family)
MKRSFHVLIVFFFSIFALHLPLSSAEETKSDPLEGFDLFVAEVMKDWSVPGLAISIVKDGKLLYAKGFGFRDVDRGLDVTPDTLFAIGSCTKAFTATALAILVDEGKLNWDKPVREYLPTFKLDDHFATDRMTPRDLVCHRSGLPRHDLMWYNSSASRKELFDRLQYLKPSQDFRTVYQYQNLMFMTAGYLVGKLAGVTWEDFVQKHILDSLHMANSNFSVEVSKKASDFALPYMKQEEKVIEIPFRNIDTIGPAGSINSSVKEMASWVLLNLNKGKFKDKQIVSENSLREVQSPQMIASKSISDEELFYRLYGMGWGITSYRGHLYLSHGGGIDGFTASVSLMPQDKIGICILTNLGGNPATQIVAFNACDRLLGLDEVPWNKRIQDQRKKAQEEAEKAEKEKDKDRKQNTMPSHPLGEYAGEYSHPGYGIFTVTEEDGQLKAMYNSIEFVLDHYHYDIFEAKNEMMDITRKMAFFSDKKGNISRAAVQLEPAVEDVVFTRKPSKKMMEKEFLEKFVGEYSFDQVVASVALKDDNTLTLTVPGQPTYELVPYKGTEFTLKSLKGFRIEFILDEYGEVIELKSKQPNGIFTAKKK